MSLAAQRSSRQREDFVMRLGCVLVSVAVLASLVLEPPRAKAADALTLAAVDGGTMLLAGYLAACGMTSFSDGANARDIANMFNMMGEEYAEEYLKEQYGGGGDGPSFNDWLGMITFTVSNGIVRFGKDAAEKLNQFAAWVASKYGTKVGVNVVYGVTGDYVLLADGSKFYLCTNHDVSARKFLNVGTPITQADFPITFATGYSMEIRYVNNRASIFYLDSTGNQVDNHVANLDVSGRWPMYVGVIPSATYYFIYFMYPSLSTSTLFAITMSSRFDIGAVVSTDESLSLDVSETMQEILDRLSALEEGQSIALDVGATQSMELQEILQGILDAILAGDLAASAEIVDTAEVPVEPEEPDPPVVSELPSGLDKLGAALTSRFPFSIPWDVYKGVKLLAAPAKAPYFEVDFFEPIGHLVGGWKGSTKIVLDMSEYEIIGQVCRWTSTIGFCLMLASGTKRLIWTA